MHQIFIMACLTHESTVVPSDAGIGLVLCHHPCGRACCPWRYATCDCYEHAKPVLMARRFSGDFQEDPLRQFGAQCCRSMSQHDTVARDSIRSHVSRYCPCVAAHLVGLPKPLLPVGGSPIIDNWLSAFSACALKSVYIVTSSAFERNFSHWAGSRGFPVANIITNGAADDDDRQGAVADLQLVRRASGSPRK